MQGVAENWKGAGRLTDKKDTVKVARRFRGEGTRDNAARERVVQGALRSEADRGQAGGAGCQHGRRNDAPGRAACRCDSRYRFTCRCTGRAGRTGRTEETVDEVVPEVRTDEISGPGGLGGVQDGVGAAYGAGDDATGRCAQFSDKCSTETLCLVIGPMGALLMWYCSPSWCTVRARCLAICWSCCRNRWRMHMQG